ncbi:MAG: polymer-forming cytoskeletal protein [Ignavibacteriales bacterium]|nr:polymer-forming cytoskeletal protein [Ignavibacteriales bacterium]
MAIKKESHPEDVSIISAGVKIDGDLHSEGNVRIDGGVTGNITINGNLTLGESSEIKGIVKAQNVNMNGKIEGSVIVSERLKLESKSVMKGDITAKVLIVDEGALFDGSSKMNSQAKSSSTYGE